MPRISLLLYFTAEQSMPELLEAAVVGGSMGVGWEGQELPAVQCNAHVALLRGLLYLLHSLPRPLLASPGWRHPCRTTQG